VKTNFFNSYGWRLYVDYTNLQNSDPIYRMIARKPDDNRGFSYNNAIRDSSGNVVYDENGETEPSKLSKSFISSNLVIEYDHPGSKHSFGLYDETGLEVFWNYDFGQFVYSNGEFVATNSPLYSGPDGLENNSTMVYDGTVWGEWSYNPMTMTWEPLP
jgi:hypothetical protein